MKTKQSTIRTEKQIWMKRNKFVDKKKTFILFFFYPICFILLFFIIELFYEKKKLVSKGQGIKIVSKFCRHAHIFAHFYMFDTN